MAKQTFTTGQVLTAAQMTSLQQTAMLGGAASAKTASYTLVAADAGTAISMSSASATTITVNTALFAAGDTVQITNLGVGVCTITAGTATVNTSASLALAQYESGTLDFTSTSAAIFIKGAGAAAASGGITQLATGNLSGSTIVTISGIVQTHKNLYLYLIGAQATSGGVVSIRFNGDSAGRYSGTNYNTSANSYGASSLIKVGNDNIGSGANTEFVSIYVNNYYLATTYKAVFTQTADGGTAATDNYFGYANYNQIDAITSIDILNSTAATFTGGTYTLFGVS